MIDYKTAPSQSWVLKFTMKQYFRFKFHLVLRESEPLLLINYPIIVQQKKYDHFILHNDAIHTAEQWTKFQVTEVTQPYIAIIL